MIFNAGFVFYRCMHIDIINLRNINEICYSRRIIIICNVTLDVPLRICMNIDIILLNICEICYYCSIKSY